MKISCDFFFCIAETEMDENASPSKKLEDLIHLAELCVDLLQQNNENYAEVCVLYYVYYI